MWDGHTQETLGNRANYSLNATFCARPLILGLWPRAVSCWRAALILPPPPACPATVRKITCLAQVKRWAPRIGPAVCGSWRHIGARGGWERATDISQGGRGESVEHRPYQYPLVGGRRERPSVTWRINRRPRLLEGGPRKFFATPSFQGGTKNLAHRGPDWKQMRPANPKASIGAFFHKKLFI